MSQEQDDLKESLIIDGRRSGKNTISAMNRVAGFIKREIDREVRVALDHQRKKHVEIARGYAKNVSTSTQRSVCADIANMIDNAL